jgi:hypothetical protein
MPYELDHFFPFDPALCSSRLFIILIVNKSNDRFGKQKAVFIVVPTICYRKTFLFIETYGTEGDVIGRRSNSKSG